MKYAIRAVKYFLYITVIFAVVIWVLACIASGTVVTTLSGVTATLVNGWKSVGLILGVFAAVSCFYPMIGYIRRPLAILGSLEENRAAIDSFMGERGYVFEKQTDESLCYRIVGSMSRLSRSWEDRVTITQGAAGLCMEGLRKDVVRLAMGLETRLGAPSGE